MFLLDPTGRLFHNAPMDTPMDAPMDAQVFDPARRRWSPAATPAGAEEVSAEAALTWLQRRSGFPERAPVGLIGPNEAPEPVLRAARAAGALLGRVGLTLLCGGREGVMEAGCHGAHEAGGLAIALLPGDDPADANPYASVVMATGIGEARNALIAQSGACLVAAGDSYGTLSEVALGLRMGKRVIGLTGAARVEGVWHVGDTTALAEALATVLLALPPA